MHDFRGSVSRRFARLAAGLLPVLLGIAGPSPAAETSNELRLSALDAQFYTVRLNGALLPSATLFVKTSRSAFVPLDALDEWNLEPLTRCAAILGAKTYCSLDSIRAVHVAFDALKREYAIDVQTGDQKTTLGDLQSTSLNMPWRAERVAASARERAAFLNYDFHGTSGGLLSNGPLNGFSSLLSGGFTVRGGTLTTNLLAQVGNPSRPKLALLDTTWQHDDSARHTTLYLGDSTTSGGTFGAETRYFGVGWTSNFETDPSFVTSPTIALGGVSKVPSVVDLYVNNALTYSKDVPAGPFEVNNLPTVNGQGEVKVVIRDLLGRQQVVTGSYYGTPTIIRQGLNDFAVEAGFARDNYGLNSLQYGPPFVEGNVRRGLSNRFTAEFHGEIQAAEQEGGLIGNWLVPRLGVFNLGIAANRGTLGSGNAALAGYDYQSGHWNAGASIQLQSPRFWQLGNGTSDLGSSRSARVHLGLHDEHSNSIGLAYAAQTYSATGSTKVLSVSVDRELRRGDLEIDALRTSGGFSSGLGVQLFYNVSLGKRRSLNIESDRGPTGRDDKIDLNSSRGPGPVSVASRLQIDSGDTNALSAQITRYGPAGTEVLTASAASNALAFEADLTGGVASIDHRRYYTPRLFDAFAVVHVGYPNVRVYEDEEFRGVTDRHGNLAISNLSAYESTTLRVESKDLPAGIVAVSDSQTIMPTFHAATSVWFATQHSGSVSVKVVTAQGVPLASGTQLYARGATSGWPVGPNGIVRLSGVGPGALHINATSAGVHCQFTLMVPPKLDPTPTLASVSCLSDQASVQNNGIAH